MAEWRRSGKPAGEFAADKGYAGSTLQWAASRLRRAEGGRRRRAASDRGSGDKPEAIRLARVVRRTRGEGTVSELLVEVSGARIAVRSGFDVALLSAVVRALKGER